MELNQIAGSIVIAIAMFLAFMFVYSDMKDIKTEK